MNKSEENINYLKNLVSRGHRNEQGIIPFLGAAASIPEKSDFIKRDYRLLNRKEIERVIKRFGIEDKKVKIFAATSMQISYILQQKYQTQNQTNETQLLKANIITTEHITQKLSDSTNKENLDEDYNKLNKICTLEKINIGGEEYRKLLSLFETYTIYPFFKETLASASQSFQSTYGRDPLIMFLSSCFDLSGIKPTPIHEFWAQVACDYLSETANKNNFLIMTTNFDRLMEDALEKKKLPYGVLSINVAPGVSFGTTNVKLSENIANKNNLESEKSKIRPKDFYLKLRSPIVLLYKIHGSLVQSLSKYVDTTVITADDYRSAIALASKGEIIPGDINRLMIKIPILFIGYGFNDLDIQLILKKRFNHKSRNCPDYAVVRFLRKIEKDFLNNYNIELLDMDIYDFIKRLRND